VGSPSADLEPRSPAPSSARARWDRLGVARVMALLLFTALAFLAFANVGAALSVTGSAAPKLSAKAAILVDAKTGRVLFSENADARLPIASTTKIMTALVALEQLPLDAKITASEKAAATIGSRIGLQPGEVLSAEQLLNALLIESANDAAVALAEAVADSVEGFADQMNTKAQELGLENTHYVNPHGMNAKEHYSSARDLATLATSAMKNETFREIVGTWSYTLVRAGQTEPQVITNHNLMLENVGWITGIKTGRTPKAGCCLVASGTKDGVSLISVILGEPSEEQCQKESQDLLKYGFSLYKRVILVTKGQSLSDLAVPYHSNQRLSLVSARTMVVSVFRDETPTIKVRVDRAVTLPVRTGEAFGSIEFFLRGEELGRAELVAGQDIGRLNADSLFAYLRSLLPPGLLLADRLQPLGL